MRNKKAPLWSKFDWDQYESDICLRLCSLAAQGLWMRMLCAMHKATPYGHLVLNGKAMTYDDLAVLTGRPKEEIGPLLMDPQISNGPQAFDLLFKIHGTLPHIGVIVGSILPIPVNGKIANHVSQL